MLSLLVLVQLALVTYCEYGCKVSVISLFAIKIFRRLSHLLTHEHSGSAKKKLVGRRKKCFTTLSSQRTRGAFTSSFLQPSRPNREDLKPGHLYDLKRDVKLLTAS